MATAIEKRLNAIERMLKELSGRIEQRPVAQTTATRPRLYLIIDKGNVLSSGQDGVKHVSSVITSLPSAYDPNVASAFIDGIGRGQLIKDGVIQPGYVLICNDPRSAWGLALLKDDAVAVSGVAYITSGASSVAVYIPV